MPFRGRNIQLQFVTLFSCNRSPTFMFWNVLESNTLGSVAGLTSPLVVRGEIPPQIDGTYYRVMPDALWAPLYDDDVFINGDGAVDAVRIKDGHADFKQKFVRTEKFTIERAARKAVYGKYRNRYTDDPRVRTRCHATANTHVVYFENQLLALKEDSLPYAMNPDTLETKGKSTTEPA